MTIETLWGDIAITVGSWALYLAADRSLAVWKPVGATGWVDVVVGQA
ncbi:MAG: hypothetical protein AAGE52_30435 [Myxococcota bacterium]